MDSRQIAVIFIAMLAASSVLGEPDLSNKQQKGQNSSYHRTGLPKGNHRGDFYRFFGLGPGGRHRRSIDDDDADIVDDDTNDIAILSDMTNDGSNRVRRQAMYAPMPQPQAVPMAQHQPAPVPGAHIPAAPPAETGGASAAAGTQALLEQQLAGGEEETINEEVMQRIRAVLGATKIDLPVDINDPYDLGLLLRHLRHHSNLLANIDQPEVREQVLAAMQEEEQEEQQDAANAVRDEVLNNANAAGMPPPGAAPVQPPATGGMAPQPQPQPQQYLPQPGIYPQQPVGGVQQPAQQPPAGYVPQQQQYFPQQGYYPQQG